jgi:hypothetical protein
MAADTGQVALTILYVLMGVGTFAFLAAGGFYVYKENFSPMAIAKQEAEIANMALKSATGGLINTDDLMNPAAGMAKAQEMVKQKALATSGLPTGVDMTSMNPDALKNAALEKAGGNMPSIPDPASLTATGLEIKNINPNTNTLTATNPLATVSGTLNTNVNNAQEKMSGFTGNATANAADFKNNLSNNLSSAKEQFGPAFDSLKDKGTEFLNKGREQLPGLQKKATDALNKGREQLPGLQKKAIDSLNKGREQLPAFQEKATDALNKLKNNTPQLSTGAKVGLGLLGARAIINPLEQRAIDRQLQTFKERRPTGQIKQEYMGEKGRAYQDELRGRRNMTRTQGGGRKTKNNKPQVINEESNTRQSVKRQRKPRTKKCLVSKGNQLYMSFCV